MLLLASTLQLSAQSRQYLHEGWTFGEARFPNRYPAQVPGVVHTDLLRQGLIDDPYIGLNERKVQWVDKEDWKYPVLLGSCEKQLQENFGHSESLYACNTYQFSDYSRYAMTVFKEEEKRKYRDEHFDTDLKNAYELGKRLAGKCLEG